MLPLLLLACAPDKDANDTGSDALAELELVDPADWPASEEPPDVLTSTASGAPIRTPDDWWAVRRPELHTLFQHYVYGYVPEPENVEATVLFEGPAQDASATLREVELTTGPPGTPTARVALWIPPGKGPFPVLLGLNKCGNHSTSMDDQLGIARFWVNDDCDSSEAGRGLRDGSWPADLVVERGFILATVHQSDFDPDDVEDTDFSDGIHPHIALDAPDDARWASISAWSWGLSRVVDHLETVDEVDPERIGVIGHSRRGKAALWAAALDDRIALAVPHQSGTAGATLSRSYNGEPVATMNELFPTWFPANFKAFGERETHLPVDQHMLLAMVAPRRVLVTNGSGDFWADPEGALRAVELAEPVFELLGSDGIGDAADDLSADLAWHERPGGHSLERQDWETFLEFADR